VNKVILEEQSQESKQSLVKKNEGELKVIIRFLIKLVLTCLIVWGIFSFIFGIARMEGQNMYPRIMDGDLMFYYRLEKEYYIGDVVTYKVNGYRRAARVVAKGGDIVEISEKGQLIVNGNIQEEEIFYPTNEISGGVSFPYTVEEGGYFLLCDYRTISLDSRDYGAVLGSDIDGKVITILRRREI
jgi:signal peptidase I